MTEAEWNSCTEPQKMLEFIIVEASDRKLRLFGVACCRRVWHLLAEGMQGQMAVEVSELAADGIADEGQRRLAEELAREYAESLSPNTEPWVGWDGLPAEVWAAQAVANAVDELADRARLACLATQGAKAQQGDAAGRQENAAQALLLRCIFGNPFQPAPTIGPAALAWNDRTVVRLAQRANEERSLPDGTLDRARLAVLADALEETGVTDTLLLKHLRGPGPHVRGCFAIDTILGRT